ncbi:hypothetical protein DEO72_LG11g2045 [Vigna unguiculata]|uniref:Uncharacterized protein n=1 Tax=Vigna unguiculata TaxID=3917 RepID=A0A4D6NTG6_VIGUN|nr:hypothetical protein DEO72_LG11g2045 [Vigna unguiculata]
MKGEEKSEVVETMSVIVGAGAVSADDQIQRYKGVGVEMVACYSCSQVKFTRVCHVFMVIKGFKVIANLNYFFCEGLDEASERTSCLKDRKLFYDVYHRARKAKFCASRLREDAKVHMTMFGQMKLQGHVIRIRYYKFSKKELNPEVRTMEDISVWKSNNV